MLRLNLLMDDYYANKDKYNIYIILLLLIILFIVLFTYYFIDYKDSVRELQLIGNL
jgi:hypothetical protein